jgi:antitoxin MazE
MRTQLVKWRNSLAVYIPGAILKQAAIDEGESLNVSVSAGRILIEKSQTRLTLKKLLAGIRPENLHGEDDWGKPCGNELW